MKNGLKTPMQVREEKRIIRMLRKISKTKSFAELQEEEKRARSRISETWPEKSEKEILREQFKETKGERRLNSILSCFYTEWQQSVFQIMCLARKPVTQYDIKHEFQGFIGDRHVPSCFKSSLERIVGGGFAFFRHRNGMNYYSPTRKGIKYALPASISLMEFGIKEKTSCAALIGPPRNVGKSRGKMVHCKIKILRALEDGDTRRRSDLLRATGMDESSMKEQIAMLKEDGLIRYNSTSASTKYGYKSWKVKTYANLKRAKDDHDVILHYLGSKAKYIVMDMLFKSRENIHYDRITEASGVNGRAITSFIALLERKGYARARWNSSRLSEATISEKGRRFLGLVREIRNAQSNLKAFNEKYPLCPEIGGKIGEAYGIYYPRSKACSETKRKGEILVDYLGERGEAKAREIYRDTPIRDRPILDELVRLRVIKRREKWRDVIYYLPRTKHKL